jgi:hypothetical protein
LGLFRDAIEQPVSWSLSAALQLVDPVLQRVDLPHQVFDRGLLRQSRASHHRCQQNTYDEST